MSNADRLARRGLMDLTQVVRAALPKEGAPAVAVRLAPPPRPDRSYRVSTRISEEAGARYERLIAHVRVTEGRRMRGSDVIERALAALEREIESATAA